MLPYSCQCVDSDDIEVLTEVLKSPLLTQGPRVESFEKALASYAGVRHALVFNSATSALYCAYRALGIREGDEVITTPISFVATSSMLLALGAIPVFCDVKPDGNINEEAIPALITHKTRAIVSVDYSGNPVAFDRLREVADSHNLAFLSDSSHSIGAEFKGVRVGNHADATIFSFHAVKPITTGEGGALLSNDEAIYEQAKRIRSHGVVKKHLWNSDVEEWGFNFRMSDFAAALGESQLKKLDRFITQRQELAHFYDEYFRDSRYIHTLKRTREAKSSHHLYPIFLSSSLWCVKEEIFAALHKQGIGVQVHYKPIHTFTLYRKLFPNLSLPNAESFYRSELSIPCHQKMNIKQAREVAEIVCDVVETFAHSSCSS